MQLAVMHPPSTGRELELGIYWASFSFLLSVIIIIIIFSNFFFFIFLPQKINLELLFDVEILQLIANIKTLFHSEIYSNFTVLTPSGYKCDNSLLSGGRIFLR